MRQFSYFGPLDLLKFFVFQLNPVPVDSPSQFHDRECSLSRPDRVEIIITYNNMVFLDTALGLRQALLRLGLVNTSVAIMVDGHLVVGDKEEFRNPEPCSSVLRLQIALAPHEETMFLDKYIAFHMEQSWSVKTRDIMTSLILSDAVAVWCFSGMTATDFKRNQFLFQSDLRVIPVYSDEGNLVSNEFIRQSQNLYKVYDVAFFGSHSDRRSDILHGLFGPEWNTVGGRSINLGGGFYGGPRPAMSGEARNRFVLESKVSTQLYF
jgi:hypothetical protein